MIKTVPIVTAFAAVAIATFLYIGYQFFGSVSVANDARELVVAPGETVKNISADLSVRNVIKNDFWFRGYDGNQRENPRRGLGAV